VTNATTIFVDRPDRLVDYSRNGTISITVNSGSSGQDGNISVTAGNSFAARALRGRLRWSWAGLKVLATVGVADACYNTLKLAFDNINSGRNKGAITIKIHGSTSETATAALNAAGSGSASYTSILIYRQRPDYSINGSSIPAGSPLINLNGADNVTFDGSVNGSGSTQDLTITTRALRRLPVLPPSGSLPMHQTIR